jgi:hypothetical protein
MRTYYLYFVGPTGRIEARQNIDAPDDETASGLAGREGDGRAMELWLGSRKVRTFEGRLRSARPGA